MQTQTIRNRSDSSMDAEGVRRWCPPGIPGTGDDFRELFDFVVRSAKLPVPIPPVFALLYEYTLGDLPFFMVRSAVIDAAERMRIPPPEWIRHLVAERMYGLPMSPEFAWQGVEFALAERMEVLDIEVFPWTVARTLEDIGPAKFLWATSDELRPLKALFIERFEALVAEREQLKKVPPCRDDETAALYTRVFESHRAKE